LAPHELPDPDDLTAAADPLFVELDRREQSRVKTPQRGEVWLVDLGLDGVCRFVQAVRASRVPGLGELSRDASPIS
jgi:hypothetical protein